MNPQHNNLSIDICADARDATVDFLLEDESGQRFVFMVTGNLLKSIPC